MAKKTELSPKRRFPFPEHGHQLFMIAAVLMFMAALFIGLKFHVAKKNWMKYGEEAQTKILRQPVQQTQQEAQLVAYAVVNFPESAPLIRQPALLQEYVETVSKGTGKDLIIVDTSEKILAATLPENVGKTYKFDEDNQVGNAINKGETADFYEKSEDYPAGIQRVVVPLKDSKKTWGAVILSTAAIPEKLAQ